MTARKKTPSSINTKTFQYKNDAQRAYADGIRQNRLSFGIGPAGTGKTFIAVKHGIDAIRSGASKRLIITRPAVSAGEQLGFLPGDMDQKLQPYLLPIYDAIKGLCTTAETKKFLALDQEFVAIAPIGFMRGRTFSNCFVIVDEAQNLTYHQLKMAITRIGENCKMVLTGDPYQTDLPKHQSGGLPYWADLLSDVEGVHVSRLSETDVVRDPIVKAALEKDREAINIGTNKFISN